MAVEIAKVECVEVGDNGKYGRFVVEPLERGFGHTLGNSLRRVLLSSLPGAAASAVHIEGVQHEFSTIPGVKEDVTEIILNLKGLAVKMYSDGPKSVIVDKMGPCELTAADIKVDDEIEIVVQINGKIKDKLMIPAGLDKDGTQEAAMNTEKIKGLIEGKNVVKVIAVPGKLVNIVVK